MVTLLMSIFKIGTDIGYIMTAPPEISVIIDLGATFLLINFAKVHLCLFSSISKKCLHHPRLHHRLLILDIVIDDLGDITFNKNFFCDLEAAQRLYSIGYQARMHRHYLITPLLTRIVELMWL